jgi:Flp pilus assembly protein TadD
LTGLPEADAQSAISVLLGLGLLRLEEEGSAGDAEAQNATSTEASEVEPPAVAEAADSGSTGVSLEWVEELVARKLNSVAAGDYYAILGADRIAPTSKITASYHKTRQTFESFRADSRDRPQLAERIESLLVKIDEAHATLSDPDKRRAYDQPFIGAAARSPQKARNAVVTSGAPAGPVRSALPPPGSTGPLVNNVAVARVTRPDYDPLQLAQENYRRGRGRFDRNDFHTAVHHFREAVKLDATQARYHYYLGVTLMILAQARKAAHSHTHDVGCHVNCSLGGGLARNPRLRHEAEQHMLRAAELDRSNPEIRLTLARIYQEAGMEKKAGHYYLETLMIDASNDAALKALGIFDKPAAKRIAAARRLAQ